jgi:hypothetical protein
LVLLLPDLCRGQVPGFLGGFDASAAGNASSESGASSVGKINAEFDWLFQRLTMEAFWCCFSWGDADYDYRHLPYQQPRPLAGGPWLLLLLAALA